MKLGTRFRCPSVQSICVLLCCLH